MALSTTGSTRIYRATTHLRHVADPFSRNINFRVSRFSAEDQKLTPVLVQVLEADEAGEEGRLAAAAGAEEAVAEDKEKN